MATASPAKHDRIERHIQRQRGAGVRSLATSFGFSFGLPIAPPAPPAFGSTHAEERPAKRRKSTGVPAGQGKAEQKLVILEQDAEPQDNVATNGELQNCSAGNGEESEDIVHSKADDDGSVKTRVAPKKSSRSKKLVKGVRSAADISAAGAKPPAKKRGRPKKALDTEDEQRYVAPNEPTERMMAMAAAKVAMGLPADSGAEPLSIDATKPATKRKGRPRKNPASEAAANAMPAPIEESDSQPAARPRRHAATTAMTKVSEGLLEEESDITKKRREDVPKRAPRSKQRAKNDPSGSTEAMPGKEPETSGDRADEPPIVQYQPDSDAQGARTQQGTARKTAQRQPAAKIHDSTGPDNEQAPLVRKSTKGASAMTVGDEGTAGKSAHTTTVSSAPSARPRRQAAEVAEHKVASGFIEEASDISKKRRDPDGSTGVGRSHPKPSGRSKANVRPHVKPALEVEAPTSAFATDAGKREQRTQIAGPDRELSHERRPLAEAVVNIRSVSPAKNTPDQSEKKTRQLVQKPAIPKKSAPNPNFKESTRTTAAKRTKAAKIFVDSDAAQHVEATRNDAISQDTALALELSLESSDTGFKKPHVDHGSLEDCCKARQSLHSKQETSKKNRRPDAQDKDKLSSKDSRVTQHKTDINEDVDWLFDVPKPSLPKKRAAKQLPIVRQERKRMADTSEIDLDDLLSNIATFVPQTKTSQVPPVQVRATRKKIG
ncbi:hypothetical protein CKM354_000281200 [Cercospora kikuchii]|uniref:Uncharacterized protein n=1 Tax=Cercospora kikuchii TaxID=84275 RepID=A0A9P3C8C1_9PEZI|nr:uncharacterized protein CKM354_000281200 [Cercospora kikuchii]GIZ39429.1 hypothetical protein CKM354_000281200 [Cercospora kikuchii]